MKNVIAVLMIAFASLAYAMDDDFIPHMGDVPLMEGLTEVESERVVFDKPGGAIVDVTLKGQMSKDAVFAFYNKSLSALGWIETETQSTTTRNFSREGQVLSITAKFDGTFKVHLKPAE